MALNLNKVILAGRLTAAPEVKQTSTGKSVCNFRIAVSRKYAHGNHPESDFFPCQAWGATAEFVGKHFSKGSAICVVGRLQNRSWEKDGTKHTVTEVNVDEANLVESKSEATPIAPVSQVTYDPSTPISFTTVADDSDLPF